LEGFVEDLGDPTEYKYSPIPPSGPPDEATVERVAAVASEHRVEILPRPAEH
jgi:hypothetical protein